MGSGALVFAIMGYVIANFQLDRRVGAQVRLNPVVLATILGEDKSSVDKAIEFLCSPDRHSTSKEEAGRRLVRLGEFDYQVVNGAKYHAMRNEEDRREQNRMAQQRFREKLKRCRPTPEESRQVREFEAGTRTTEELGGT